MALCPLPSVTWCLAGGPWGQRSLSGWPAPPPALPTDTQAGAGEGHQEALAWHEGEHWQWGEKMERRGQMSRPLGGDAALLLPQPLPRQNHTLAPLPGLRHRVWVTPHPPKIPKLRGGGKCLPTHPRATHRSEEVTEGGRAPRPSPGPGEPGEERTSPG